MCVGPDIERGLKEYEQIRHQVRTHTFRSLAKQAMSRGKL